MIVPTMMLVLALVAATEAIIANKAEFKLQKIEPQFDAVVDADAKAVGKAIEVVEHKARKALNLQSPRAAPSSDITW
jgi:hypothetical protein